MKFDDMVKLAEYTKPNGLISVTIGDKTFTVKRCENTLRFYINEKRVSEGVARQGMVLMKRRTNA